MASEFDNIKTLLRIRPFSEIEIEKGEHMAAPCLKAVTGNTVNISMGSKSDTFSYDHVRDAKCSQEEIFELVGKIMADNCLEGYNGTIFA